MGLAVGNVVGLAVGIAVGNVLGLAVGLAVGPGVASVGKTLGLAVGLAVGRVIGAQFHVIPASATQAEWSPLMYSHVALTPVRKSAASFARRIQPSLEPGVAPITQWGSFATVTK